MSTKLEKREQSPPIETKASSPPSYNEHNSIGASDMMKQAETCTGFPLHKFTKF